MAAVAASGCAVRPAVERVPVMVPVAVWYRGQPGTYHAGNGGLARLEEDLAGLRSLGFNTVVVDRIDDAERGVVSAAARRNGLGAVVGHRATDRYVRSGALPAGVPTMAALVRANLAAFDGGHRPAMHRLPDAPGPGMLDRLRAVQDALAVADPAHPSLVLLDDEAHDVGLRPGFVAGSALPFVATSDAEPADAAPAPPDGPEADATRPAGQRRLITIQATGIPGRLRFPNELEWALTYHAGLARGFTDGILFYAYGASASDRDALGTGAGDLTRARRAAVKRLTSRALRWGSRLQGARRIEAEAVRVDSSRVATALFARGDRRFLLVYNRSAKHFARGTVRVPVELAGVRIRWAIDTETSRRQEPRGATIPIAVRLKPGDGLLYELVVRLRPGRRSQADATTRRGARNPRDP